MLSRPLQPRPNHRKPPKLRIKAGAYVKHRSSGEVFRARVVYRTFEAPSEWVYVLETTAQGRGHFADAIAAECGASVHDCIVIWEPLSQFKRAGVLPGTENFYWAGDCVTVPNRTLLKEYAEV